MGLIQEAATWLSDPINWTGPNGIPARLAEHLDALAAGRVVRDHRPGDGPIV
jgi:osmoprotectant transport system permease protein